MSDTTTDSQRSEKDRVHGGEASTHRDLSRLPSVERVMSAGEIAPLVQTYGRTCVRGVLRKVLAACREAMRTEDAGVVCPDLAGITSMTALRLEEEAGSRLRTVFNLTGTVLHTNLGRALLPEAAVQCVVDAMTQSVNLEFDLATGRRGDRDDVVSEWLCELTGAEAATVVNNNAAAVLLMLSALAARKEVVVSRGELI